MEEGRDIGSHVTISKWENDKQVPSLAMAIGLAKILNVTVEYLVSGERSYAVSDDDNHILEAIHGNPRLSMLFACARCLPQSDVDTLVRLACSLCQTQGKVI
mgnify:FL=1